MDKFVFIVFLVYAVVGAFFYGYEFGMEKGSRLQRIADNDKLQNCHRVITRIAE